LAYLILGSIAVLGRLFSVLIQFRIQSPDPTGGVVASANWTQEIGALLREKALIRFIAFGAVSGFWMAFLGALCPLYALNELGASPAEFTGYSIAATLSGTACVRLWGKLIDRHGAAPVLMICFIGWKLGDFGWIILSPETRIWMFLIWTWGGALATGYLLATFNLLLKLIPRTSRSAGISLNLTAVSIVATVGSVLAGSLIKWAGASDVDLVFTYRAAISVGICGCLASAFILFGIQEPKTNPTLNTVHGAMRTLRQLTVNQGLAFFGNTTFIARRKPKK
jgi:Na+/melibiose symporter-like transporter